MTTTPQEILKREFDFLNVTQYHKMGYKGKGIVVFNTEDSGGHGDMTTGVLKTFAPEITVINGTLSGKTSNGVVEYYNAIIDGVTYDIEDVIKKFNVKITSTSLSGKTAQPILDMWENLKKKYGIIMFNSAGNEASAGVTGRFARYGIAIAVGALYLDKYGKVTRHRYSSIGDEMDFGTFLGYGSGTSAACPSLAAQTALLLQRYGDFNHDECYEILKSLCIDLGEPGEDNYYGYGIPVLPLTDKLEILERIRGDKMADFKDVEDTRWSKEAIDFCAEKGLLVGFEDGTFRPTEFVTREQLAIILQRILNL